MEATKGQTKDNNNNKKPKDAPKDEMSLEGKQNNAEEKKVNLIPEVFF